MIRLFVILLSLLLVFGWGGCAIAQTQSSQVSQQQLQKWDKLARSAFAATSKGDFATAEQYWTEIIEQFPDNAAAWSNRGNSRVSQNKLQEALADFNKAIELAPDVTDPYLNRGTALEGLGRWEEAIVIGDRILEFDPNDAMAYNNRGTAKAGLGEWQEAIADYKKSMALAPNLVIARGNYALVLYETGQIDQAIKEMKNIVRKYPNFADTRAALTAALWVNGQKGEAESNWVAASGLDRRYKDINWVKNIRRWPPSMVVALDRFLNLK
jgi:tetratricopeptide (TPR) repeat protein